MVHDMVGQSVLSLQEKEFMFGNTSINSDQTFWEVVDTVERVVRREDCIVCSSVFQDFCESLKVLSGD